MKGNTSPWWNNKKRPTGAGTVSRVRKERFQQKGFEDRLRREFEQLMMTKEDKRPWNETSELSKREHTGEFPSAPTVGGTKCPLWGMSTWKVWKVVKKDEKEVKKEEKEVEKEEKEVKKEDEKTDVVMQGASKEVQQKDPSNRNKKPSGPVVRFSEETEKEMAAADKQEPLIKGLVFGPSPAQKKLEAKKAYMAWDDSTEEEEEVVPPTKKTKEEPSSSSKATSPLVEREVRSTLDKRAEGSSLDKRERWHNTGHQRWVMKERPGDKAKTDVCVDWFNTIYVHKEIPERSVEALWLLHNNNCNVHMVSFCGFERELEVRGHISGMTFPFTSLQFTCEKAGVGGKAELMCKMGWKVIFDDSMAVLTDCKKMAFGATASRPGTTELGSTEGTLTFWMQ